jgi:hypothetical protein
MQPIGLHLIRVNHGRRPKPEGEKWSKWFTVDIRGDAL